MERLDADGAIVGIFPEETFQEKQIRLSPDHRLVVFSDGVEEILASAEMIPDRNPLMHVLPSARDMSLDEMMLWLAMKIDNQQSNKGYKDDATVLVMDISEPRSINE